ncbi:MAG: nuclear transport factor 2 family protein [Terracidiphilus sp.]
MTEWFDGLNRGDLDGLLALFTDSPTIKNAAFPPDHGEQAPRRLLESFFSRTSSRHFQMTGYAENGDVAFASWIGLLTFAGQVGGTPFLGSLPVCLTGVEEFHFRDRLIDHLDIVHETTTIAVQARRQGISGRVSESVDLDRAVRDYFRAEEVGDVEAIVSMFDADAVIRNAAQPPVFGKEGARKFVSDFRDRTEFRKFSIASIARQGSKIFASWRGHLRFKAGVVFGPGVCTAEPFEIELSGVCEFDFTEGGAIHSLLIAHETTTATQMAMKHTAGIESSAS